MRNWLRPKAESYTEKDGSIRLELEMPGINKDEINLEVEGNTLTVSGERKPVSEEANYVVRERRIGEFSRTYNLGQQVDPEKIEANLENGVLTLHLPVKEKAKPRQIPVKSG